MIQPALLGGLFIGVLSALPIVSIGNCCCCLWVVGGGMVAAYLDQQNDAQPITVARGARAGVLAGIAGAFVWLFVSLALDPVLAPMQDWVLSEVADNAQDMPPEARELFESLTRRDSGFAGYAAGFVLLLCAGSIFSTIGGVIGAVYFRNDIPPALGGPIPPPAP